MRSREIVKQAGPSYGNAWRVARGFGSHTESQVRSDEARLEGRRQRSRIR
jgi:hypothetical protein